mgnify:CR=1 FL=1
MGESCNTQSLESQEKKENPNFKGRLGESKEGLGESERDPGWGVSDQLGESAKVTRRVWSEQGKP